MDERYDYQRQLEERERRMREDDERRKAIREEWAAWAKKLNQRSKEREQIESE